MGCYAINILRLISFLLMQRLDVAGVGSGGGFSLIVSGTADSKWG
jgi:hypothetical protein